MSGVPQHSLCHSQIDELRMRKSRLDMSAGGEGLCRWPYITRPQTPRLSVPSHASSQNTRCVPDREQRASEDDASGIIDNEAVRKALHSGTERT
jgi:hypothetical protein